MESVMLEHYYVKPSTIDRIRDSWLGSQIENYVGWMEANGYSSRTVFRRLPRLFRFAEFVQKRGCTDVASAVALVEDFVSEWLVQHGPETKTSASLRKHAIDIGNATRQMLRLASGDPVRHNRHRRPFPLESEVPGFQAYLRSECGLMESTIRGTVIICMSLDNTSEKPASLRSAPCRLRFWHLSSSNVRREWLPARAAISVAI
jgi:integrase/recombinase XerD